MNLRSAPGALLLLLLAAAPVRAAGVVPIVAAENFYGDVARQIGGEQVNVTSILSNPDQDPHLFEASPSVARALSAARIVIVNGLDYDPWAEKLLAAGHARDRKVIVVAALLGTRSGDNPHLWYEPGTMPTLAEALADALGRVDPAHRADYARRLDAFRQSLRPMETRRATLRARLAGVPVTATEPVFGYMLQALGMSVRNQRFQLAVMNNTEPSASEIAAFEEDLKQHRVRLLVYNRQASGPIAGRMLKLARASGIAVIGVSETEPPGMTYQQWMAGALEAIDHALPG